MGKDWRRSWTDDDLRAAVTAEHTWKAVARRLGLAQSSSPRLQRRARQLGLSVSHFTGKRRWSDFELRQVIESSSTWGEVIERLAISDITETRLRLKGYAVRLHIDVAHLNGPGRPDSSAEQLLDLNPDLSRLRMAAESIAVAWFTVRGVPVAIPAQPCQYDLLVTLPSGLQRVQVKSSAARTKTGTWNVGVGRRPYSLDKTAGHAPYDPDELDYFFVIDGDAAIYFIPSQAVAGRVSIFIRPYSQYRVGDASSLLIPSRYQQLAIRSA